MKLINFEFNLHFVFLNMKIVVKKFLRFFGEHAFLLRYSMFLEPNFLRIRSLIKFIAVSCYEKTNNLSENLIQFFTGFEIGMLEYEFHVVPVRTC